VGKVRDTVAEIYGDIFRRFYCFLDHSRQGLLRYRWHNYPCDANRLEAQSPPNTAVCPPSYLIRLLKRANILELC
jgi:hypothetical protein